MTHKDKVRLYASILATGKESAEPSPLWALMWRAGLPVRPPEFLNPLILFVGLAVYSGVGLTVIVALVSFVRGGISGFGAALVGMWDLIAGGAIFTALVGTIRFRLRRTRYGFPPWSSFGT